MSKKLYALAMPVLAIAAFAIVPTMASATVSLRTGSTTGTVIPVGNALTATSTDLLFTAEVSGTPVGSLECAKNVLEGKVKVNKAGGATSVVAVEKGTFLNASSGTECKTSLPGTPTAKITTNATPKVFWLLTLTSATAGTVTGNPVAFTAVLSNGLTCSYEVKSISVTMTANPNTETLTGVGMTLQAGSSAECPPTGKLNGKFTITSAGAAVFIGV